MRRRLLALLAALGLAGCATVPTGPSVMVLPGQGKSFEQFQADNAVCQQWAAQQAGAAPGAAADQNLATGAVAGTLLGAALGAAIGAASGSAGIGAAVGAGSGLLGGTLVGAGASQAAYGTGQWRFDIAYQQCMYAKGNQIPAMAAPRFVGPLPSLPPPPSPGAAPPPKPPAQ
jgi:hypothetical protein